MIERLKGKANIQYFPKKSGTTYEKGAAAYFNGLGSVDSLNSLSRKAIGIFNESFNPTDAGLTSTPDPIAVDIPTVTDSFLAIPTVSGVATPSIVLPYLVNSIIGKRFNLDSSKKTVNIVASDENGEVTVLEITTDKRIVVSFPDTQLSNLQAEAVSSLQGDGVGASASNLNAAIGSAGALTGTFYYTLTFVTADGETAPWPGTATAVSPVAQRVNLTSIPVSASPLVIARNIYRTDGITTEPKNYRYHATINDNTTTTYTDNDAVVGSVFASWSPSNLGYFKINGRVVARVSDQTTAFGDATFGNGNPGYASTAIGYAALQDNTSGRRNTAVGVYALENNTNAYENTALGVHAGGGITQGASNTMIGYAAGGATQDMLNFNTAIGSGAFSGSGATKGSTNTFVGYRAGADINTADACVGLGYAAGKYANASRQVFIDGQDRTNLANSQNIGLIYGKHEAAAINQVLHLNAVTRISNATTVALLTAAWPAAAGTQGYRGFVTDANAATFGTALVGGGANAVPVYCDGTTWRIG